MKQPLMVVPPAQAEALYDAELDDETRGAKESKGHTGLVAEEWDDRGSHDLDLSRARPAWTRTVAQSLR